MIGMKLSNTLSNMNILIKKKRYEKMIKCPNCGSTAQVRIISQETFVWHELHIDTVNKCQCGCGKQFAYHEETTISLFKYDWAGYEHYINKKVEALEALRELQRLKEERKRK
jgi:Zn ribbon nucleic-acid-binding protein